MTRTLRVELTPRPDGTVVFRCTRPDGTAVWQTHARGHAAFFPAHDLTHFAVERALGFTNAFYGLVADGWALTDFGAPWPRGPLPPEASAAELIVGYLDRERGERAAGSEAYRAADLADFAATYWADHGLAGPPPALDDATLQQLREARDSLLERWRATPTGETMTLDFAPDAGVDAGVDRAPRPRSSDDRSHRPRR